ncbi:MAG TPA: nuclear transport factor 2 family protein [Thermoleophilaceae bacterium]
MGDLADTVTDGIRLFNERRYEESLAAFTDDVEWRTGLHPLLGIDATRGRNGVREFWREAHSGWDDFRVDPIVVEELDGSPVLVTARYFGRGHASGVEFENQVFCLYELRDGLICSVRDFGSREAALAAAKEEE